MMMMMKKKRGGGGGGVMMMRVIIMAIAVQQLVISNNNIIRRAAGAEDVGGGIIKTRRHHVVGEDRGWDASSDIASWSSRRLFLVGDDIWFAYSAAEEMVVELSSKDEFENCNVSNPIRTYAEGLNIVALEDEGPRYFASRSLENCKNGLKLHVEVIPRNSNKAAKDATKLGAEAPKPSASARLLNIPSARCQAVLLSFSVLLVFVSLNI